MKENIISIGFRICPKCGQNYHGVPALSMVQGLGQICPDCGTREALESIGVDADEQERILESIHKSSVVDPS